MKKQGKITIIASNEDIIKFCIVENIDIIQFKPMRFSLKNVQKFLSFKKTLDNIIKKINPNKEDAFFLTGNIKVYDAFYLAKELSKKCVIYYKNPDFEDREFKYFKFPWYKPFFIRGAMIRFFLKTIFGIDLVYYEFNSVPCLGIDDVFLKKYNIKNYAPNISSGKLISDLVKNTKLNHKEYDNLIIDQQGLEEGTLKNDSVIKLYKELFKLPINFAIKKHPNPGTDVELSSYGLFDHCEELPKYIPAELLCNNIKKNVLSIYSISLITASQLPHLNVISLLELVEWDHGSYKKEWKDYLTKTSKNKILFPNSFGELKEILLSKQ